DSVAIVSTYLKNHQQIRLYEEPNSGTYHTRNKLLKLAKGDYIYNLDADDYIVHNCLKALLNFAQDDDLDIIGFQTKETTLLDLMAQDELLSKTNLSLHSGQGFLERYPLMRHEPWWYFIKRNFVSKNDFTFTDNQYNADVVFTLEAFLKASKVGFYDGSIHRYVQTEDSIMRSKDIEVTRKRFDNMQMMILSKSQLINTLKSQNASEDLLQILAHRRDTFTFFNLRDMIKSSFIKVSYVKASIESLKDVGAYPMHHFSGLRFNSLKHRVVRTILNNESMLYAVISLRSLFSKSIK
ncbi:MAG: glycosyltransferase, partial [Bacteroidota bacterium]